MASNTGCTTKSEACVRCSHPRTLHHPELGFCPKVDASPSHDWPWRDTKYRRPILCHDCTRLAVWPDGRCDFHTVDVCGLPVGEGGHRCTKPRAHREACDEDSPVCPSCRGTGRGGNHDGE